MLQLNDKGDMRHPCRTPLPILNQSVISDSTLAAACWSLYRLRRVFTVEPLRPIPLSTFQSLSCLTVSNAFLKSTNAIYKGTDASFAFSIITLRSNIWSLVPTPFRKPIYMSAICSFAVFCIRFSNILRSILLAWLISAIVRCSSHFIVRVTLGMVTNRMYRPTLNKVFKREFSLRYRSVTM